MNDGLLYKAYGPDDRITHEPGRDPWWQESAFLGWADAAAGIGGAFRLGLESGYDGVGGVSLWAGVTTPDHAIYKRSEIFPYTRDSRGPRRWSAGQVASFAYDDDSPALARWMLRDKDISLDLEIEDLHTPVALLPSKGWSLKERQASDHLECGLRVRGEVMIAGRSYAVDGGGYRDHSWGVRHWDTLVAHRWATGTLDSGMSFCICAFSGIDGSQFKAGMVMDHASDTVIRSSDIDIIVFAEIDACSHRGGIATIGLPDGRKYELLFEPIGKAPVAWHHGVACLDAPCRVRCGDVEGVGVLETNANPQQGATKPLTLVSAIIEDGMITDRQQVSMPLPALRRLRDVLSK